MRQRNCQRTLEDGNGRRNGSPSICNSEEGDEGSTGQLKAINDHLWINGSEEGFGGNFRGYEQVDILERNRDDLPHPNNGCASVTCHIRAQYLGGRIGGDSRLDYLGSRDEELITHQ